MPDAARVSTLVTLVAGFGYRYAIHFPDGAVAHRVDLERLKHAGEVVMVNGERWRIVRVEDLHIEEFQAGDVDYELDVVAVEE
jgi:hypothetical protein